MFKKNKASIYAAYLKKCAPTMRSRDCVLAPIRLRSIVDVLVARTQ
jgi:hypothetical protein